MNAPRVITTLIRKIRFDEKYQTFLIFWLDHRKKKLIAMKQTLGDFEVALNEDHCR